MTTPHLLGLAEVAELYSISKNSANAWTRRHDFPAPVAKLAMGPVWSAEDVLAWRRPIADPTVRVTDAQGIVCPNCAGMVYITDDGVLVKYGEGLGANVDMLMHCDKCRKNYRLQLENHGGAIHITVKEDL